MELDDTLDDTLEAQVAARDAHDRWPGWTFARTLTGWQAKGGRRPRAVRWSHA